MRNLLAEAIALAYKAHNGQVDKANKPYIHHPMRVMLAMIEGPRPVDWKAVDMMIVAVLHDVVEDTTVSLAFIQSMFGERIADAVDALSRRKQTGESYWAYIQRLEKNPVAMIVKRADLNDNLGRINEIPDEQKRFSLAKRYTETLEALANR